MQWMKHLRSPLKKSAEIALRTQQLLAYETGVANVVDPLGGSWYLEHLTDKIESDVENYFTEIENLGGVIPAIEEGYFQRKFLDQHLNIKQRLINLKELL